MYLYDIRLNIFILEPLKMKEPETSIHSESHSIAHIPFDYPKIYGSGFGQRPVNEKKIGVKGESNLPGKENPNPVNARFNNDVLEILKGEFNNEEMPENSMRKNHLLKPNIMAHEEGNCIYSFQNHYCL